MKICNYNIVINSTSDYGKLISYSNNWNQIKDNALNSVAPCLIHKESEIINRTLRDMYDENTKSVIIEGNHIKLPYIQHLEHIYL